MGLYDDLPTTGSQNVAAAATAKAQSNAASTMAQRMGTMIQHRRVAAAKPPPQVKSEPGVAGPRTDATSPGVSAPVKSRFAYQQVTPVSKKEVKKEMTSAAPSSDHDAGGTQGFQDDDDPYNPADPNDYMMYCEERLDVQRRAERERELKLLMEDQERERIKREKERSEIIKKIQEEAQSAKAEGRTIMVDEVAPAMGGGGGDMMMGRGRGVGRGRGRGLSNLPAWMTAAKGSDTEPAGVASQPLQPQDRPRPAGEEGRYDDAMSSSRGGGIGDKGGGRASPPPPPPPPPPLSSPPLPSSSASSSSSGMDFASSYMAKMGHKEGQGLGKGGQGISQPLVARGAGGMGRIDLHKDDTKRVGFVGVEEEESRPKSSSAQAGQQPPKKRGLFSNPTRVLLLKNMVGPGEVDAELEGETKEECSKYGPVKECRIFELKEPGTNPIEAVRIFVAFERQESAVKAFLDMSGRFFGGRQITTVFYDEDRFANNDWRPRPDESK